MVGRCSWDDWRDSGDVKGKLDLMMCKIIRHHHKCIRFRFNQYIIMQSAEYVRPDLLSDEPNLPAVYDDGRD